MKVQRISLLLIAALISLTVLARVTQAQATPSNKLYQQMARGEQTAFIAEQARRIARRMSGTEYEFTPAFETEIQKSVEFYARRIGNNGGDVAGKGDARFVFERGRDNAPILSGAFKAHGLSPLLGLYIPLIESEYTNISQPNSVGAIGMFQFLPKTGARFGLTAQELLDVEKSAAAAARYILKNIAGFKSDAMKEALALLAYNRGERAVERDLALIVNEQNKRCSICALTAARDQLDATFQKENVYYVPSFFAAAIVGENPQVFGLQTQPLSSYEMKR
ncbi:MAG: transglycosylase SLT domain-containing protein [Pyrinomonadaceae bacterium]